MFRLVCFTFMLFVSGGFPALAFGEYAVGFVKMEALQKETNETISIAVVYPTMSPAKPVRFGPFSMELAIGGDVAKGPFPLAVISHGSGGSSLGHRSIAFALVKQGFVVAMPLHPKNNYKDNSAEGIARNWINRPKHIESTIDALLTDATLSSSIDNDRISVIGHSAGGYTALAVAGGVAETGHMVDLCNSHAQLNEPFCGLAKAGKIETVRIENTRDARVKAVVLMAPVGVMFKSSDALAHVEVPVLLMRAERDDVLTEPYHSDIIAMNLKSKERLTYRTIPNAGHHSFITPLPESIRGELGVIAEDPQGFDRDAFHNALGADIANYLLDVVQ